MYRVALCQSWLGRKRGYSRALHLVCVCVRTVETKHPPLFSHVLGFLITTTLSKRAAQDHTPL